MPIPRHAEEGQNVATMPSYDMSKACQGSERSNCLEEERQAGAELDRRWQAISAADRSACIPHSTAGVEPSYVELLTCIEMSVLAKPASQIVTVTAK
jgi:hypothetical protein